MCLGGVAVLTAARGATAAIVLDTSGSSSGVGVLVSVASGPGQGTDSSTTTIDTLPKVAINDATVGSFNANMATAVTAQSGLQSFANLFVGSNRDSGSTGGGVLQFTTPQNMPYTIAGNLVVTDSGTDATDVLLYARLRDNTAGQDLFLSNQISTNTLNETLTIGQANGETNTTSGSATGTLLAGHDYTLEYGFELTNPANAPSTDGGASARGTFVFAVPEPGAAGAVVGLLAGTLGRTRRRR
jgi:hypothetical protein